MSTAIGSASARGWMHNDQQSCPAVNVGTTERWLSAGAGVAALLGGARLGGATGLGLGLAGAGLLYRAASGYCSLYEALGVSTADPGSPGVAAGGGERVCRLIDVDQPVAEVYRFWRNLENLPQFMQHLKSVKVEGDCSHWEAEGPLGVAVAWDAQIINERANELLAWQSLPGSQVDTAGSVHFEALGDRRTRIRVVLKYSPPGGKAGIAAADLLGADASVMIEQDLRQLKHLLEARGPRAEGRTTSGQQVSTLAAGDDTRQRAVERVRRFILHSTEHDQVRGQSTAVRQIGAAELERLSHEMGVEQGVLQDVLHDPKLFVAVASNRYAVVG